MKAREPERFPRISLTIEECAISLGMSESHFKRYVLPDLKVVRSGKVRVIATAELHRWVELKGTLAA